MTDRMEVADKAEIAPSNRLRTQLGNVNFTKGNDVHNTIAQVPGEKFKVTMYTYHPVQDNFSVPHFVRLDSCKDNGMHKQSP